MMTKYAFVSGRNFTSDAQATGEFLARIAKRDGSLKTAVIVAEARPVDSPIHGEFQWDDALAAEAHRRDQASMLIRCIRVVKAESEDGEPVLERVFIRIVSTKGEGFQPSTYYPIATVMSNPELRQQAIADALTFLSQARAKLKEFQELQKQYLALAKVEDELVDVQMKLRRTERASETTRALQAVR